MKAEDGTGPGRAPEDPVSFLEVEAFLAGTLEPGKAEALRRRMEEVPALREYVARMRDARPATRLEDLLARDARERAREAAQGIAAPGGTGGKGMSRRRVAGLAARFAGALAVAGLLVWFLDRAPEGGKEPPGRYASKGAGEPEVELSAGERTAAPGGTLQVTDRDTLAFRYRSAVPVHARAYYSEDGGPLRAFDGWESVPAWPAAQGFARAPDGIAVDGGWKAQEVVLVAGPRPLPPAEAESLARSGRAPEGMRVFRFSLIRSAGP